MTRVFPGVLPSLRTLVVIALLLLILLGMFLPIYTDEIGWRLQERAGFEGVDKMYSDQCGPDSLAVPPFFMMPVRYYSAFFNGNFADPFYIRVSGILYALLWLAMLRSTIHALTAQAEERMVLVLLGSSLLAFGIVPLLLIWSRPEQPLLLCLTGSILLALRNGPGAAKNTGRHAPLAPVLILILSIISFSYHMKGVVLAPAFLLCLAYSASGRRMLPLQLVVGAFMVGATLLAARYWMSRVACSGDPLLAAAYARQSVGVILSGGGSASSILFQLIANADPMQYFAQIPPVTQPMSEWLEPHQLSEAQATLLRITLRDIWMVVMVICLIALFARLFTAIVRRDVGFRILLPIFLVGYVLFWGATQNIKNVYELSFIIPLLVLALLFLMAGLRPAGRSEIVAKTGLIVLGVVAVASVAATTVIYAPSLLAARQAEGYLDRQPFSVPVFGYSAMEPRIRKAAALCGLSPNKRHNALMIDDLTYFSFMQSRLPQHRLGVIAPWNGSVRDPIAYLHAHKSDGAILACRYLPPAVRARAKEADGLCCLGGAGW